LSPREVEAAWRRKLIDRLAGLEVDTPTQFDDAPRMAPLGANCERLVPDQRRGLKDVIRPAMVARGIKRDLNAIARKAPAASKGARMMAIGLSSAVLTGVIWVSAYAVISGTAQDYTAPAAAAFTAWLNPEQSQPAAVALADFRKDTSSTEVATTEVAILDNDPALAPAPAKPTPVKVAKVQTETVTDTIASVSPAMEPAAAPAPAAQVVEAAPVAVLATPAAPALAATTAKAELDRPDASARDKVLAMFKSTEDSVASTVAHLNTYTAPVTKSATPAPTVAAVRAQPATTVVARARRIIRTRVVRSVTPGDSAGPAPVRMALGAPARPTAFVRPTVPSRNIAASKPEVLPWTKAKARAKPQAEVLPWAAANKPATVRKGRIKTKVFRAASAASAVKMLSPGAMAFVAPAASAPSKPKAAVRTRSRKSANIVEQFFKDLSELGTVSSQRN
jgi:hypothetical protein